LLSQTSAAIDTTSVDPTDGIRKRKRASSSDEDHPVAPSIENCANDGATTNDPLTFAESDAVKPKSEPKQEDDNSNILEFVHPKFCSKFQPCKHPVYGTGVSPGNAHPGMIYNNHEFKEIGEATEHQLQFVISRLRCEQAQLFHGKWEVWQRMGEERRGTNETSKEKLLSKTLKHLNTCVRNFCPEMVDLTMDD
jgi:hypothetical protein